jgi:SAM-dependent methyltransferase
MVSPAVGKVILVPFPARLVCPRCRQPGKDNRLTVAVLEAVQHPEKAEIVDQCPVCGTCYPRIDDVRCVPPDLADFQRSQASALDSSWLRVDRVAAEAACRVAGDLDPGSEAYRELLLLGQHGLAHYPEPTGRLSDELSCNRLLLTRIAEWIKTAAGADCAGGCALEVGCGPGVLLHVVAPLFEDGAMGLDLRISMLRLARWINRRGAAFLPFCSEGSLFQPVRLTAPECGEQTSHSLHFVQGDVAAPPLEAEAFPLVMALSLLDTVWDPLFALSQLDALLAPGGLLLLGTPYSWSPLVTPPSAWWSKRDSSGAATLRLALEGHHPALPHLQYELLSEEDRMVWAVPGHGRLVFRFFLDLILARKRD